MMYVHGCWESLGRFLFLPLSKGKDKGYLVGFSPFQRMTFFLLVHAELEMVSHNTDVVLN